ncbi:MAG TPA: hypothetical protein VM686_15460, partial [Polyangiaceae bacterium]|nr:hypothetical protein [Polyangiaceae bacterium]
MRQAKRQIKNPLTMFTALAAPLLLAASCAVGPDPDEDSGTVGSIGQGACEFAACAKGTGCPPDDECADWACDMNAVCCVYTKLLGIGDPCKDLEGKAGTCVTTPAGYPACCAGCIDRSGNCQPGTDVAACGPPGSECVSCDSVECHTTSCNGEKCLYEPQNGTMCSGGTCDDGSCCQTCFEGGTCYDLNDDQHCGPSCDACGPCERCVAGACQPKADGDSCDDGDACTEPDACSGGTCQGTTVTCNDNNECTTDSCDPASGCDYAPKAGSCNDGSACTTDDSCVAGECVGVAVVCDDGNFCTADGCDDEMGCVYTSKAQDTPCDDGNACSPTSACRDMDSMGNSLEPRQCVATSGLDCNDNDPCTSDACEENGPGADDDTCQNPRQAINEGGGCSSTLCMTGQTCAAGACQGGMALDCDDANTCTADGCEPAEGCTHAPADETCNDGNPCTLDDACDNGACAGVEVECAPLDSC